MRPRRPHVLSDAAKKRDPTQSNDLRRRIATGFRHDLNEWRKQVYATVVEADALGYDYGDVNPDNVEDIEELLDRMDVLLSRQAEFNFLASADKMDLNLRTAYARGVRKAGEEIFPVLPFTQTSGDVIMRSRAELEAMLEDQIAVALEKLHEDELAAALASRRNLYLLLLLPLIIRPLQKRLQALANTSVTRSYNAGKIDAYEAQGVEKVGVEPETQPPARGRRQPPPQPYEPPGYEEYEETAEAPRLQPPMPRVSPLIVQPEMPEPPALRVGGAELYTVETVGDDKVCAICESYEGVAYTLEEARALIPAHPNCRCSVVPLVQ